MQVKIILQFKKNSINSNLFSQRTEAHVEKQSFNINQRNKLLPLPTRSDQIKSLNEEEFDVLVIGGGATGSGCVLDAATRGLKTAMVEADDFSSGTSSRSTKLIHGGLRYLQKAIMKLDYEQYKMVEEALHERGNLLDIAPHLSFPLPIMLPVYKYENHHYLSNLRICFADFRYPILNFRKNISEKKISEFFFYFFGLT
jgi:glycerol-3-phosphate dehydrogenase